MTEIRFGGRCEKHLCPKPCTKCAEAGDSSTITVPRETWDALREKIETALTYLAHSGKFSRSGAKYVLNEALTAANAASEPKGLFVDLIASHGPEFVAEMAAIEPQAQGESSEYARGFADGMNEAPTGDCWIRAIDEAMVGAHLGVADMGDDYGTAKEKLNTLICWHVEVAMAPQATEPASCHQTGVCVRPGLAAENHARLVECARRLVEHADFQLGGILSADSKAKDMPSKAVSQVKSRHLAALRDALPAAPEAKQ